MRPIDTCEFGSLSRLVSVGGSSGIGSTISQSGNAGNQRLATLDFPSGPILSRVRCIALFSLLGLLRFAGLVDLEFSADLLRHELVDLTVSRNRGYLPCSWIDVDSVPAALA